jgi:hypothetical protein
MLPLTETLKEKVNTLPKGGVFLCYPSLRCIGTFGHGTPVLTAFPFRKSSKYIDTCIEEYALT